MDIEVVDAFRQFLQLDVDAYIQRIGSIGFIAKTQDTNVQQYIDQQVSAPRVVCDFPGCVAVHRSAGMRKGETTKKRSRAS